MSLSLLEPSLAQLRRDHKPGRFRGRYRINLPPSTAGISIWDEKRLISVQAIHLSLLPSTPLDAIARVTARIANSEDAPPLGRDLASSH